MKNILISILGACLLSACADEPEAKAKEAEAKEIQKLRGTVKELEAQKEQTKEMGEKAYEYVQEKLKDKPRNPSKFNPKTGRVKTIRQMLASKDAGTVRRAVASVVGPDLIKELAAHYETLGKKEQQAIDELEPVLFADILFAAASEKEFDEKQADPKFRSRLDKAFTFLKDEVAKLPDNIAPALRASLKKALPKIASLTGDDVANVGPFFQ